MNKSEFLNEIEIIANAKPNTVKLQDNLADLPEWDSMSYISFIAMADERLGATVDAKALASCRTVEDLVSLFRDKLT